MGLNTEPASGELADATPSEVGGGALIIAGDRDLLNALGLSISAAAIALDKSRQTIHAKLGSLKSSEAKFNPADYFGLGEIANLVDKSNFRGRSYPSEKIWRYVSAKYDVLDKKQRALQSEELERIKAKLEWGSDADFSGKRGLLSLSPPILMFKTGRLNFTKT